MASNNNQQSEVQGILNQQRQLKLTREKVAKLSSKNIFIISGDQAVREVVKGYLETLEFPTEKINTSNVSDEVTYSLKKDPSGVDLVVCHQKALDSRVSSQTGMQLLKIVKNILINRGSYRTVPFIFIEKGFEKKDIINGFKAGASQFVVLPSSPVSLGNKLMEVFEKPRESQLTKEVADLLIEGNKLQGQGLFEKAIAYYNQALTVGGENVEVLTEKANTLLKVGDIDQSIQLYKRVTEIEVNFPRAYQGLGMAYEQLGDMEESKNNYKKVIELEPHNVQVHYNLGTLYQDEGDYEEANIYFKKGISLNKNFIKNYLGLAKNYEALDHPQESLKVYKQAMENNPKQTFLYITTGDFCLKHNMNKEAEEVFSQAISSNEKHIHLYNRMGIALRKQKKFDQAISNFAKAIKINPNDANLRYNLAKAYYIKGEEIPAIEKLLKAFSMSPELKLKFEEDVFFSKLMEKYPEKFNF